MAFMQSQWIQSTDLAAKIASGMHKHYRVRPKRYLLGPPLSVLARPKGIRCYSFWLKAENISATGMLLRVESKGFVPFKVGGYLQSTVDLSARIFQRPLHLLLKVVRVETDERGVPTAFGCQIVGAETNHIDLFWEGFNGKIGSAEEVE